MSEVQTDDEPENRHPISEVTTDDEQENRHPVTERRLCKPMGIKNGFGRLKRIEPTGNSILRWDCVFQGKQTSFEDDRYE